MKREKKLYTQTHKRAHEKHALQSTTKYIQPVLYTKMTVAALYFREWQAE